VDFCEGNALFLRALDVKKDHERMRLIQTARDKLRSAWASNAGTESSFLSSQPGLDNELVLFQFGK
jgi:hypothetical protein